VAVQDVYKQKHSLGKFLVAMQTKLLIFLIAGIFITAHGLKCYTVSIIVLTAYLTFRASKRLEAPVPKRKNVKIKATIVTMRQLLRAPY
jgi:hypothetical protein